MTKDRQNLVGTAQLSTQSFKGFYNLFAFLRIQISYSTEDDYLDIKFNNKNQVDDKIVWGSTFPS